MSTPPQEQAIRGPKGYIEEAPFDGTFGGHTDEAPFDGTFEVRAYCTGGKRSHYVSIDKAPWASSPFYVKAAADAVGDIVSEDNWAILRTQHDAGCNASHHDLRSYSFPVGYSLNIL